MTPQEKAIEIFNSMKGFRVKHSHAKKCALNAVKLRLDGNFLYSSIEFGKDESYEYWEQVEIELKKIKTP